MTPFPAPPDPGATVPMGGDPFAAARRAAAARAGRPEADPPVVTASAWCRVTVCAPHRTADVALPTGIPVAELVPMLLDLLGRPPVATTPARWRLMTSSGVALPPAASLAALGLLDGELLQFRPDAITPPPPVLDDPVDVLARAAGEHAPGRGDALRTVLALLLATVAAGVLTAGGAGWPAAAVAGVLALGGVVVAGRRPPDDDGLREARVAALAAVPFAAAAGWTALPGGAAGLLLAATAAGVVAAAGQLVVRVVTPALLAAVTVAATLSLAATGALLTGADGPQVAAIVAAVAVAVAPFLPRCALRLAGVPRPIVASDLDDLASADPACGLSPDELADRADLARGYLTGTAGAVAVVAAGAASLASPAGWSGAALAGVVAVVLGLRTRGTTDASVTRVLTGACVVAGLAGLVPVALAGTAGAAIAVAALVGGVAVLGDSGPVTPTLSPVARRALDMVEAALVAAAAPLAVAASGLLAVVHVL
ncbi:MAG: type VII secretion integral membrane protein EccD [Pseudonocardia sp.]|uniref:type VII secretion integral membrane protein EccD n=1 Tax=unclassified Pseudonocardia TaxID=2619320 RepID=UPI00086AB15A|nr:MULTISPECIES: type VII secretion integral membrane protein EccD [unclassified Pseudonocardia]MBN9108758.1 type VII secretion integral membrane protein EccD [Pseudonocardia sp.]ODU23030.1 MAG: type VII secretion integral membrane protein EccD [Pseudonocardia sp. SCN 72-51]ODV07008.1 MAG: type VII secretion integral membrane protein EccD [Pseudonocardia sp. SCN 73-27]